MSNIAIVIQSLGRGGAERVASELSSFFEKEHHVTVVIFEEVEDSYSFGHETVCLNSKDVEGSALTKIFLMLKRAWRLKQIFKQKKIEKVFSFIEMANFPASLAFPNTVVSVHCNPDTFSNNTWALARWIYPKAKAVVGVSRDMAETLRKKGNLNNVTCIYNPIDVNKLRAQADEPLDMKEKFMLAMGRLEKEKRFDLLIEAYAKSKVKDECSLIILGEGSLRSELEEQIASHGLEGKVSLPGFTTNPFKYVKHAQSVVLSSDTEGFPMSLIEALALGCPVIATDCPTGPREIIKHRENGLLVEVGNSRDLARAMEKMYFDLAFQQQIRAQTRLSVAHLNLDNIGTQWLEISQ